MHDLHVADQIFRLVLAEAEKNRLKKVAQINIELGLIEEHGANVEPENLKFNIVMLSRGTIAEAADVVVNSVAGNAWKLVSISGE
ncbi:hypothetical protein A2482_05250 [Candidatus Falkowbacteria bacterium RIFOXYC2_FULL_48_21]|uniref:Hydrogenase maturation nickel metallochaperone HypA n=1 Tax=Candidatus Falkowbacteria bacterium RIFOXYC2_FULL_48_21 TaxID=1798005 RepID=A0A1F5TH23_9BACT|nr:MAG: hypothetical protein A2482_05250 [Candidatus Falkowbacteria bacterium RIFOXYC2_FULL_48_21]